MARECECAELGMSTLPKFQIVCGTEFHGYDAPSILVSFRTFCCAYAPWYTVDTIPPPGDQLDVDGWGLLHLGAGNDIPKLGTDVPHSATVK